MKFIISPLTMKDVDTTAIIDSGAQINCIDWAFVRKHQIPTRPLKNPFPIRNTDQTSNIICHYEAVVYTQLGDVTQKIRFYVINGGKENAILGHSWLEVVNPIIDWKKGTITIPVTVVEAPTSLSPFSPTDCTLYSHFSFNDFITVAFPDLTRDLDNQI